MSVESMSASHRSSCSTSLLMSLSDLMFAPVFPYGYRRPTLESIREARRDSSAFLLFDDRNVQFGREVGEQRFPGALEIRARAALVGVCRERACLAQAFDGARRRLAHAAGALEELRVMPLQ